MSGRRKAQYEVSVKNKANAPLLAAMEASDQDNAMGYAFSPAKLEVQPGETKTSTLVVRPPKQIWLGRPQERRLQVRTVTGEEAAAMEAAAPVPEGLDEFEGEHAQGEYAEGEYAEGEFAEGEYEAQPPPKRRFGKRKQGASRSRASRVRRSTSPRSTSRRCTSAPAGRGSRSRWCAVRR